MMRIVVADRNETMRLGMRVLFSSQLNATIVDEVADRVEMMATIQKNACDVLVVDPLLCAGPGEALIRQILRVAPRTNVLVYTELDELKYGVRAIRSGARGYVMKSRPSADLLAATRRVGMGKMHMSEALAEEVALYAWEGKEVPLHETLSEREKLVFSMLVCGWSVTSIASVLHLSAKTVSTHKARTMAKMRCKSLSELIEYAFSAGLKESCEAQCAGL
jgi:two-component system invasion response regulator UvrY